MPMGSSVVFGGTTQGERGEGCGQGVEEVHSWEKRGRPVLVQVGLIRCLSNTKTTAFSFGGGGSIWVRNSEKKILRRVGQGVASGNLKKNYS